MTYTPAMLDMISSSMQPSSSVAPAPASALPEEPGALLIDPQTGPIATGGSQNAGGQKIAKRYAKYIPAGWSAQQPLSAHDKFVLGVRDTYSPFSFLGYLASAGYSHITNGQPNYGTDKGAFGQRLGATVIRDASEGFFTDSIFSPMLHEDPRYYVEGSQYSLIHRFFYAITRPLITRSDSGRETVNAALLLGYGAGSAISYTYYPAINQNAKDTIATFGGSLAGAAVGDFTSEFTDSLLVWLHLEKKQ